VFACGLIDAVEEVKFDTVDCPDCRCGRSIAFIAAWLSVYMRQFGSAWWLHSFSSASCIAVISVICGNCCSTFSRFGGADVKANVGISQPLSRDDQVSQSRCWSGCQLLLAPVTTGSHVIPRSIYRACSSHRK
jgi:hypothetical protein